MNVESKSGVDVTQDITNETIARADVLQRLAFDASIMLSDDDENGYFLVSREYYSGLFYGFLTNVPFDTVSKIVKPNAEAAAAAVDIVGFFRDQFSEHFERDGPLQLLSKLLNNNDVGCSAVTLSFSWAGHHLGTNFLDSNLEPTKDVPSSLSDAVKIGVLEDSRLTAVAKAIAAKGSEFPEGNHELGEGFCLTVSASTKVGTQPSLRRQPLQLMQIVLQVEMKEHDLKSENLTLSQNMKSIMSSSKVATYSVLYERERYFEKAIKQSIKGSMIKWGKSDSIAEFTSQLGVLHACNTPVVTHAAPHILKYGIKSNVDPIKDKARNEDNTTQFPWYEMVRYNLPSLDGLLTNTPGLQEFEVRAIAKSVLGHLETHFWKFEETGSEENKFEDIPSPVTSVVTFKALRTALTSIENDKGSIEKIRSRLAQWRRNNPIQIEKKGLTVPYKKWGKLDRSFWSTFLDPKNEKTLELQFEGIRGKKTEPLVVSPPVDILTELIAIWGQACTDADKISVPWFRADKCHGDPHFENIFLDASVPEDAFIVAIDPARREYNTATVHVVGFDREVSSSIVKGFGQQPMHDLSKLLLSTTGGYALALKNGFKGRLESVELGDGDGQAKKSCDRYIISWQSKEGTFPLGADGAGVSGANLFMRSLSATPEAKWYQNIFANEIMKRFNSHIGDALDKASISDENQRLACANIYYIQVWAWVIRHTFSIAEKLFPEKHELSDQLFAFGYYLLHEGADYLRSHGPNCLFEKETQSQFDKLLTLDGMMELDDE